MKKLIYLLPLFSCYLSTSFVQWNMNPSCWSQEVRGFMAFSSVILGFCLHVINQLKSGKV